MIVRVSTHYYMDDILYNGQEEDKFLIKELKISIEFEYTLYCICISVYTLCKGKNIF